MELDHKIHFVRHLAATHLPAPVGRHFRPRLVNKQKYLLLLDYPKCGRTWLRPASKDIRSRKMRAGGADHLENHLNAEDLDYVRATYRDSWAFQKLGYA